MFSVQDQDSNRRDGETADAAGHLDIAVVVGEGGDKGVIKINFRVVPYSNILYH